MKLLLVGESNPYSDSPTEALGLEPRGASGDRLRRLLEMTDAEYLDAFLRFNLCADGWWDDRDARKKADQLALYWHDGFVLLGAKVARAFDVQYRPFTMVGKYLVLPHPSGRCRVWNDPASAQRARELIRGMIAQGGEN